VLLQYPNDLIFREPCSLHLSVLQEGRTLNSPGGKSQWQVSAHRPNKKQMNTDSFISTNAGVHLATRALTK
jgi:hypothetical protein